MTKLTDPNSLFLVRRPVIDPRGWDTFRSFIIRAIDATSARWTHPGNFEGLDNPTGINTTGSLSAIWWSPEDECWMSQLEADDNGWSRDVEYDGDEWVNTSEEIEALVVTKIGVAEGDCWWERVVHVDFHRG